MDRFAEQRLTRRRLLELGAAGMASGAVWPATTLASPRSAGWPRGTLNAEAANRVVGSQFIGAGQLRSWHEELDGRGLRATGSPAHEHYVDVLHDRLARAGVSGLRFESVPLRRWTAERWGLDVVSGPSTGKVRTAAYIPYSGVLTTGRAAGPLAYVAASDTVAPGSLRGKVALFDVAIPQFTVGLFEGLGTKLLPNPVYNPNGQVKPSDPYLRSWAGDFTTRLVQLQAGNPEAVIGILPLDDVDADGAYYPYDGQIRSVPGVYVARREGARLKALAGTGTSVRLTLNTSVADVKTRNLLGFIPGRTGSREFVVLHSHTDGPNGTEDNGPDAIVAIAQYLARLPRHAIPRTIMILLTTGHFAGGVGALGFTARHKHDLVPRIAAAITVEHLGADEWAPQPDGSIEPTGLPELAAFFMPVNAALNEASYGELVRADAGVGLVCDPLNPHPPSPHVAAWPGEGQYLYNDAGIATTNYITGPTYLLNWGVDTTRRTNFDRLRRHAIAFTEMALGLGRVPRDQLAVPAPGD
jgi:hypothetical protein